jgi:pyridinium-3,5-biscarboxylic acid mononucleotide synthase
MSMNEQDIRNLLERVRNNSLTIADAVELLRHLPTEILPSARLDHHRQLRTGLPEAVFGENKTAAHLLEILAAQQKQKNVILATRVSPEKATEVLRKLDGLTYHDTARLLTGNEQYIQADSGRGTVVIVTAGTSDQPVAEEARISLELFGHRVQCVYDAGVAGLHRILAHSGLLREAGVIIVVAGMEGALPSVVAGMVGAPVIGVPTSIGYGTGAGGISALLGMLNSCSPGLAVVNIDNGFGAACMAAAINRRLEK